MSIIRLREEILPKAFGNDESIFTGCEFDSESTGEDQFSSNVVFVTVNVQKNNEEIKTPVVVKFEPFDTNIRKLMNSNIQFYNEVYMYSKVLPFFKEHDIIEDIFAKYHYGVGTIGDSDKSVIVIEDLRPLGYHLTEKKCLLDFEHLALALSKLGKFHALSYAAKEKSEDKFLKVVSGIEEHFCSEDRRALHANTRACLHRAVDPLIKQGKHVEILQSFLNLVDNNFFGFLYKLVSPSNPIAVICHGDFCRNNILFRYKDGKPIDVKFFDIACSRYSSPVIDISFLIFLNSSKQLRDTHWDRLLEVYHTSLSTALPGTKVPSLDEIKKDMKQKAIWGFIHCSFFLPIMLLNISVDMEKLARMRVDEMAAHISSMGGEEGTRILSDMVEELVEKELLTLEHTLL